MLLDLIDTVHMSLLHQSALLQKSAKLFLRNLLVDTLSSYGARVLPLEEAYHTVAARDLQVTYHGIKNYCSSQQREDVVLNLNPQVSFRVYASFLKKTGNDLLAAFAQRIKEKFISAVIPLQQVSPSLIVGFHEVSPANASSIIRQNFGSELQGGECLLEFTVYIDNLMSVDLVCAMFDEAEQAFSGSQCKMLDAAYVGYPLQVRVRCCCQKLGVYAVMCYHNEQTGQCQNKCSDGYYKDLSKFLCHQCQVAHCEKCVSQALECQKCQLGYYLYKNYCFKETEVDNNNTIIISQNCHYSCLYCYKNLQGQYDGCFSCHSNMEKNSYSYCECPGAEGAKLYLHNGSCGKSLSPCPKRAHLCPTDPRQSRYTHLRVQASAPACGLSGRQNIRRPAAEGRLRGL